GVAISVSGNIYVADGENFRIQEFDSSDTFVRTWGSLLLPTNGAFNDPTSVACDSFGNVYVADSGNSRVQKFDSNGGFIRTWGRFGTVLGQFSRSGDLGVPFDSFGNV